MSTIISSVSESAEATTASVALEDVSLRFRRYGDVQPSFRRALLHTIMRRSHSQVSDFWLFENVNLRIGSGERIGVVGRNGAGKTTLLKVISGIYPPTHGQRRVRGLVAPLIELTAGMNIELSGMENIILMGTMFGAHPKEMKARAAEILDFAELREFADTPVKYYSTGMRMRLAFSIATGTPSEIQLMDEVFSAGDASFIPKAAERMKGLMDESHIVIFASHNIRLVRDLMSRVIWVDKGRLIRDGDPNTVCDEYLASLGAKKKKQA